MRIPSIVALLALAILLAMLPAGASADSFDLKTHPAAARARRAGRAGS